MNTQLHKEYIERNNKEQSANLNWAKQANEDYDQIRMGFLDYKTEIKDILEKHQSKHNDQIIENTIKTERTELKMSETLELVNVIRENFETFNRQSDRLDFKMID